MALCLPIRVQDQGEGQSEEDRIAKLKEYIQEVSSDKDRKPSQAVRASRLTGLHRFCFFRNNDPTWSF